MDKLLLVMGGGALGSACRYLVGLALQPAQPDTFPWATLTVNLLGSMLIGGLAGIFENLSVTYELKLLLVTGILGGFTTFSAFTLENLNLIKSGHIKTAIIYVLFSVGGGLTLAFLSFWLTSRMTFLQKISV